MLIYASLADRSLWAIVALSLIGLVDDATAAVHIALPSDGAPKALAWFSRNMTPREQGLRLGTMIVCGAAMLARERPGRVARSGRQAAELPISRWGPARGRPAASRRPAA